MNGLQKNKPDKTPSKNLKTWKGLAVIMTVITLVTSFTVLKPAQASGWDWLFGSELLVSEENQLNEEDWEIIQEIYNTIQLSYIDDVDKNTLMEGALKGMVSALEDPYSEFLNPQEQSGFDDSIEGSFSGIGIQFMMRNNQVTVIAPIDGTPAAEAGILPNDILLEADGVELTGMDTNQIVEIIRGEIGSEIELLIQRGTSTFTVTLKRADIPVITVESEIDEENPEIGLVRINQFASTTYDEMVTEITQLRNDGVKSLVFDLRYNPGGLLDTALYISNAFLTDGQIIMQTEDNFSEPEIYEADDTTYGRFKIREPYVVLVNEGSASASEILAAAIQENTDNLIVGETTFGKGTVQSLTASSTYGELKLTIAKWLTPEGVWIHDEGIEPDERVSQHPVNTTLMLDVNETLVEGDASEFVESATVMLNALGYDIEEQYFFDEALTQAVEDFQEANDLEVTGEITGDTAQLLMDQTRDFIDENDLQYERAVELLVGE